MHLAPWLFLVVPVIQAYNPATTTGVGVSLRRPISRSLTPATRSLFRATAPENHIVSVANKTFWSAKPPRLG